MFSTVLCLTTVFVQTSLVSSGFPPQIAQTKIPDSLEEGQRLIIVCAVVKGSLPISFSWRKDNASLNSSSIRIVHSDDYQDQLQIDELSADHAANYTCSARNSFGSDQMSVSVNLKFGPKWVSQEKEIRHVAGDFVKIDCRAIAFPAATTRISKGERSTAQTVFLRIDAHRLMNAHRPTDAHLSEVRKNGPSPRINTRSLSIRCAPFRGAENKWASF